MVCIASQCFYRVGVTLVVAQKRVDIKLTPTFGFNKEMISSFS